MGTPPFRPDAAIEARDADAAAETPRDIRAEAEQYGTGVTSPVVLDRVGSWASALAQTIIAKAVELILRLSGSVAVFFARAMARGEDQADPVFRELANVGLEDLTGLRIGDGHAAIGKQFLDAFTGGAGAAAGGQIVPSTGGAEAYMEMVTKLTLEGWFQSGFFGLITLGYGEKFGELDDAIANTLGIGRMSRAVMRPLLDARVITPMQWHVNKRFSPELLSTSAAIEAHLSGQYTSEQLVEELSRQGFSLERINVLVNNARKRLTFADLVEQYFRGAIADVDVFARAGELGYDQATARELLALATSRRRDRHKDPIVDAAVAGYVAGDVTEGELRSLVEGSAPSLSDAALIIDAARVRRSLHRKQLSPADERRLVLKELRSVSDYRRALERDGYQPDAVTALELELRMELHEQADAEKAKAEAAAARDAERAEAAEDRAAREADVAARKALPTLQEYRKAYVRGTIDRGSFAAAIQREKVAITPADLNLLLADADSDRDAWLAKQDHADDVRARPRDTALSIAQLEAAVLAGVLTIAEYDARLAGAGYADTDRRVLVELLNAKIEDRADAQRRREEAIRTGTARSVSLPDFERAVRLGVRTRDQYAALLEQLGTPEISRALMLDLLDAQLAQDAAARQTRTQRDPAAAAGGLSLAQRRRAVIAGVMPRADYEAALIAARWPVADQLVELELVDLETAQAAATRARRDQVPDDPAAPGLTLNQVERAVRLGLLPASALRAWLEDRGYAAADVETIVALAVAAVPDVRAGQQLEARVAGELVAKGLSLVQLQTAVRRGLRSLDDYAATLRSSGYGEDDVALLRQLLEEQLAIDVTGLRTKIAKSLEGHDDAPRIDEIDTALRAGAIDVGELRELLEAFGVARDVAIVYGRIVQSFGGEA